MQIKAGYLYFSLNFSTQMTSTMQTLPFEGHTVAYQCKGLDQNNVVCEYEVNMLTNEKVILEQNHRIAYILVTSRIIEQFSTSFYIFDRFLKIFTYIAGNLIQIKQAYKNLRSSSFCC